MTGVQTCALPIWEGRGPSGVGEGRGPSGVREGRGPSGIREGRGTSGIREGRGPSGMRGASDPTVPTDPTDPTESERDLLEQRYLRLRAIPRPRRTAAEWEQIRYSSLFSIMEDVAELVHTGQVSQSFGTCYELARHVLASFTILVCL